MSCLTRSLVYTMLFGIGVHTALWSRCVYANSDDELDPSSDQPSIEILALSRGRGVPEATLTTFQKITAVANTALESGSAVSVRQQTIGLEGETRLCIVFRDNPAFVAIGNEIRALATNVDLLQVNDNCCGGN